MKHILLGSSALVMIGLAAAPASAAEPIRLGLGGFYYSSAGMNFAEDDDSGESGEGRNDFDIHQNIEIYFGGETTLDNGILVGAQVQLEGDDSDDQIDEAYTYFSGGFGELRFGSDDEALEQTCVGGAGTVTANFGVNSPEEAFNNAGVNGLAGVDSFGSCYGVEEDGLKILYFTPQFGPFNLVASYSPEGGDQSAEDKGAEAGTSSELDAADQEDIFSVGGNFAHEGNGWTLESSLGGSWVTDDTSDGDKTSHYQAGAQVGFGAFTVGLAGEIINNYDDAFQSDTPTGTVVASDSDLWTAQVGGNYAWDAWVVGLGWTHGQMEITDSGDEDTIDYIALNGAYALGPGIDLEGNLGYVMYDDDDGAQSADYDAIEVGVGTAITF